MSTTTAIVRAGLARRYARERRFRLWGLASVVASGVFLVFLLGNIITKALPAFTSTYVQIDVPLMPDVLRLPDNAGAEDIAKARYGRAVKQGLRDMFPNVTNRKQKRALYQLVSAQAEFTLADRVKADPALIGTTYSLWVLADDDLDTYRKNPALQAVPEEDRRFKDVQVGWLDQLEAEDRIATRFNWTFFERGDSREPELAGIRGALAGSFYTLIVTLLLSFPIGVAAAVYLESFAPRNRLTDLIEVNINNLAAVPSIVFGLLGVAVFINFLHLPRSAPLVGGIVLSLMTLPTIIIASRAAIKSVPPSIADAALGLGASRMQAITHHVLPLAMPGILTGTIIGMAQALGETAPLLMIGMVAFIVDVPTSVTDPATVLPVQVYLWSDSPERAFTERTSAAIVVLLVFLIMMNAFAVYLRKRFERSW
ncbi:MAG: phosphate ABC transporter permease PstA [Pseudomonadota bacterium]